MGIVFAVLLIAVVNLALGYALAVSQERSGPVVERTIEAPLTRVVLEPAAVKPAAVEPAPNKPAEAGPEIVVPAGPPTALPVTEEIPAEWLDLLGEAQHCQTFVEASVQVLRLEVGKYRDQLISVDDRVRRLLANPDSEALVPILADLKAANQDWLARQGEAAGHLASRRGHLQGFSEMGSQLENTLLEQAAQIETTCSNLDVLDFTSDVPGGCRRLVIEICKLLDMAHGLRDRMHESLLAIMVAEDRVQTVDHKLRIDGLTQLFNRTGLEALVRDWWRDDPSHTRLLSLATIDADHFGRINEQDGAVAADRLLAALAHLLRESFHDKRGNDLVTRFEGSRFIAFLGDTGPRNATSAIERLRHVIEDSTFEWEERSIELTVSCAVTEATAEDTTETLFGRLTKALRAAKKHGRNCTFLDEGRGPELVTPPPFDVKGKQVRVH